MTPRPRPLAWAALAALLLSACCLRNAESRLLALPADGPAVPVARDGWTEESAEFLELDK